MNIFKHSQRVLFFFWWFSLYLLWVTPSFAEVKAYLNQNDFYEGDPITFKIETNQRNNEQPDLSPLNTDFDIIGTSSSTQSFNLNGKRSFLKSWTVELQPKNKGALEIPAITLGNEQTKPLNLTISDLPPEVTAETSKHIFIESSIGTAGKATFVQQQIPYTLKLFYDATLQTAQIFSPDIKNAIIEKLGRDRRYKTTRNGKKFTVVEQRFVISPEKSGELQIPAATVKGRIALTGGDSPNLRRRMDETDMLNHFFNDFSNDPVFQGSFGDNFFSRRSGGPSKPFSLSSAPINVNVLPVPKAFTGAAWLPAEDLTIKDSWTAKPPELKTGEPVTRRLTIRAKGLAGSQIPEITLPKTSRIKMYQDKVQAVTRTDGNTVYGIQNIDISYIPSHQGKITIPAIKLDWWDVKSNKQRTFTLPEWNLNVAPDLNKSAYENIDNPDLEAQLSLEDPLDEPLSNPIKNIPEKYWSGLILLLFLGIVAVAGSVFYWLRRSKQRPSITPPQAKKETISIDGLQAALFRACQNNDKQLSANALLKLARAQWQDDSIQNLGTLATRLSHGANIVKDLEDSLYASQPKSWDGRALHKLIENGLQQKTSREVQPQGALKPLYPH